MKTNPRSFPLLAGICLGLAVSSAHAQPGTVPENSALNGSVQRVELKHADQRFVEKAAKAGDEDAAISTIVAQETSNEDVRRLAREIASDHGKANGELAALAESHNLQLPSPRDFDKWKKKDPKDLDRDYLKQMISDHKDAIKLYTHEVRDGGEPGIVQFAQNALPALQRHLERANELKNTIR
ncbi:MAG TPA: DUF4142 domain-containing protein [Opitutaceae bacterium]|nr:DUF4142 domain-containing protein [Opitutaceae bacterium]